MLKQNKKYITDTRGFTLLELLVVLILIIIILGAGMPTLFEAGRLFRYRQDMVQIKTYLEEARSMAINNRAELDGAIFGVDTNFDGVPAPGGADGDVIPFAYVFELEPATNSTSMTLRIYADFSNDQEYGADDILIKEKELPANYTWETEGEVYPPGSSTPINTANPPYSHSFAFHPPFGDMTIWDDNPQGANEYAQLTVIAESDDFDRSFSVRGYQATGAIIYAEDLNELSSQ